MDKPNKVNDFIYMVMCEARRNSLVDLCDKYGISEEEMNECIFYISERLGVPYL